MRTHRTLWRMALSTAALTAALVAASPAHAYQSGSTVTEVNYGAGRYITTSAFSGGASANTITKAQGIFSSYGVMTNTGSLPQDDYMWAGMYCPSSCPSDPNNPGLADDIIQVGLYVGTSNGAVTPQVEEEYCNGALLPVNLGYTPKVTDIYIAAVTYSGGTTASMQFSDYTQGRSNAWGVTVPTWCRASVQQAAGFFDETQGSGAHYSTLWMDNAAPGQSFVQWTNTSTGSQYKSTWYLPMTYVDDTLSNGTVDGNTGDASCSGTPQVCTAWINSGVGGLYSY